MLKRLFRTRNNKTPVASVPDGVRVYAIGDVHGRLDLLDILLAHIDDDLARDRPASTTIIFLGDLIDRGPDSAGVVERVYQLARQMPDTRVLVGNHEEVFMRALEGDEKAMRFFCRIGGKETILSYGISEAKYNDYDYADLTVALQAAVPEHHRVFISGFEDVIEIGDYAFVHAGIRPGMPISEQQTTDLRWIRDAFLDHQDPFERLIVHGHTITDQPDIRPNRIGIDTGAYAGGPLTALVVEGGQRRFIVSR
ncbi:MAG: metallophosphoesterase family protein [Sphingomonas sp.]